MGGGMRERRKERSREGAPGRKAGGLLSQDGRPSAFHIRSASQVPSCRRHLSPRLYSHCLKYSLKYNPASAHPVIQCHLIGSFVCCTNNHIRTGKGKQYSCSLWKKGQRSQEDKQADFQLKGQQVQPMRTEGHWGMAFAGDLRSRALLAKGLASSQIPSNHT